MLNERSALLRLKKQNKRDLVGVEVGVSIGKNALWMLQNLDIKKLYLIDPYKAYRDHNDPTIPIPADPKGKVVCKKRLEKYASKIEYIYQASWDAVDCIDDRSVDFVYIDADHRTPCVTEDIEKYIKKVKLGGVICGHDWNFPTVKTGVQNFVQSHYASFVHCTCKQNIKVIEVHAQHPDWWIDLPPEGKVWTQKCMLCQKSGRVTVDCIEWL